MKATIAMTLGDLLTEANKIKADPNLKGLAEQMPVFLQVHVEKNLVRELLAYADDKTLRTSAVKFYEKADEVTIKHEPHYDEIAICGGTASSKDNLADSANLNWVIRCWPSLSQDIRDQIVKLATDEWAKAEHARH